MHVGIAGGLRPPEQRESKAITVGYSVIGAAQLPLSNLVRIDFRSPPLTAGTEETASSEASSMSEPDHGESKDTLGLTW